MAGGGNSHETAIGEFKLYRYDPNLAANIVFAAIFVVAAAGHVFLLWRRKIWYFIPFVIGFEAIGYIGRIIAAIEAPDFGLGTYILQTLLILLGPALFAASIYMILGRMIRLLGAEEYAVVRTKWMTKIFVTGDVLSFLLQSAGGGLMAKAKTPSEMKMAENVVLGGLGIQVCFFGFFIITAAIFHIRIIKNPTRTSFSITSPWRTHILALYASSLLIMVRSVFRMVEFGMGNDSFLMENEWYLLGLDGILMFLVAVIFLWSHPSRALVGYKDVLESVGSGGEGGAAESFQMIQGERVPAADGGEEDA
ncbi:hypothetical protein N0V88_007287 [Collariella sp. IMI 366227]|nr:hypothetical protein N0V88_007287 [Collariella sp. IMI 366227]